MSACSLGLVATMAAAATAPTASADAASQRMWAKHCADCHGKDGRSQTRLGRKSGAPDLTDKKVQAKLTDDDIFKAIKLGRKNAKGEEKMEAFGGAIADPEITALIAYVRSLAR
ncbi:MAG: cytochrome c [Opitutaceae bacterium]|nr:cytochrome c [Opitutaceae bacterium]